MAARKKSGSLRQARARESYRRAIKKLAKPPKMSEAGKKKILDAHKKGKKK